MPDVPAPSARGWEVGGEIVLVILPFLAAVAITRFLNLIYLGPASVVAGVAIATLLLRRKGRRWRDLGFCRPQSWKSTIRQALGLYLVLIATVAFVVAPTITALRLGRPDLSPVLFIRESFFAYLMFLGPLSWGTAAFGEELIARGFILNRLAEALGAPGAGRREWTLAIAGQGLIFGAAHFWQGPAGVITTTVLGILFGVAYLRTGRNLWVVIIAHGIVDSVAVTALYLGAVPPT